MPKLQIGHKPGVGGVVKVMRYNTDDAFATPNNQHGRFLFNSETTKIGYIENLRTFGFDPSAAGGSSGFDYTYYPPGTDKSNCLWIIYRQTTLEWISYFPGRVVGRGYPVVCEMRPYAPLGTKILGSHVRYVSDGTGSGNYAGHNIGDPVWWMRMEQRAVDDDQLAPVGPYPEPIVASIYKEPRNANWFAEDRHVLVATLDLPCYTTAMPVAPAGAAGSVNTIIRPDKVLIGKGGVDASSEARDNVVVSSDRVPAKVVRAGQVVIAPGQTVQVASPVTLNTTTYMDYMVWSGGSITVPQAISGSNVEGQNYDMGYTVWPNRVDIHNDGSNTLTVRYMICMDDNSGITGGGSTVMRQLPSGDIQLKRPGSSDVAPGTKDILLDTRFSYLPIVSEGYLHFSQFTEGSSSPVLGSMAHTVHFPNDGSYWPFVKYYVHRENRGNIVTHPWAKVLRTNAPGPIAGAWNNAAARDSTVAVVTDTSVKFHMARDNPWRFDINSSGNVEVNNNNRDRPIGIRYFVFAIPKDF